MRLISLQSSNVLSIAYDPGNEVLVAQFQNGDFYEYSGVSPDVFLSVLLDPTSQGKAFNAQIKQGGYPYKKVSAEKYDLHV